MPKCSATCLRHNPGCLAASFCYHDQLYNREIAELNADGMLASRNRFRERFDDITERYPPRNEVDFDMPSFTSGEASTEYLPAAPEPLSRVIQAPLR